MDRVKDGPDETRRTTERDSDRHFVAVVGRSFLHYGRDTRCVRWKVNPPNPVCICFTIRTF
jgi:hypothetical protein